MARTPLARAVAGSAVALLAAVLGLAVRAAVADAAEIKVLSTVALKAALDEELLPQFGRSTENKVTIKYGAAAALKQQIEGGEELPHAEDRQEHRWMGGGLRRPTWLVGHLTASVR